MIVSWAVGDRPALGLMTATALLGDGAADDTATGVEAQDTDTDVSGVCVMLGVDALLTAVVDLESVLSVLTWRLTAAGYIDFGDNIACAQAPGDPAPAGAVAAFDLETSPDGTTWTPITSDSWAATSGGDGTPPVYTYQTRSGAFAGGATARYVRLVLSASAQHFDTLDTINGYARLTDFRVESAAACPTPRPPILTGVAQIGQNTISGS